MLLRKGKTKTTLESSIDAALLAVEVYNKPRTAFRSEAYIAMMVIAWTRLFHEYFNATIGDKYYYKKNKQYEQIDGERKAWELSTCILEYGKLREPVKKNLEFFIRLRNKIEHRHIDKREVDVLIFGECQALLYNFENTLINLFGEQYALSESLVYTLQFSHLRTPEQNSASKDTNAAYCHYDEAHDDYLYQEKWPNLIIDLLQSGRVEVEEIHAAKRNNEQWDIEELTT